VEKLVELMEIGEALLVELNALQTAALNDCAWVEGWV